MLFHFLLGLFGPLLAPYGYAAMGTSLPMEGFSWRHLRDRRARPRCAQPRHVRRADRADPRLLRHGARICDRHVARPAVRLSAELVRRAGAAAVRSVDQHPLPGAGADGDQRRRTRTGRKADLDRAGRGAGLCAPNRAAGAFRGLGDRDPGLRHRREAAGRSGLARGLAGTAAERDRSVVRRVLAAGGLCAGAGRRTRLSRLRAASTDAGMGIDDQRKPLADVRGAALRARPRRLFSPPWWSA